MPGGYFYPPPPGAGRRRKKTVVGRRANGVSTYVMESSSSAVTDRDSRKTEIRPSSDFDDIVGYFVQNEQ